MMQTFRLQDLSPQQIAELCERNPVSDPSVLAVCREILGAVRDRGDEALREFTRRFDGVEVGDFRVAPQAFAEAGEQVLPGIQDALRKAAENIREFHAAQRVVEDPVLVETGVQCWRESRAIDTVGLYVPGGSAPLPSTALMLAVPARLAGCRRIVLSSPPQKNGAVSPVILLAAEIAGVDEVYAVGGAQAVAAMAVGTRSIPRVDKIFGPGNRYVTAAKYLALEHGVSIDALAGPSEVLVIADDSSLPEVVASDLLSQAEHDSDSRAILVSTSQTTIRAVLEAVEQQLKDLPRRILAEKALSGSYALWVDSLEAALDFSNQFAPEHLILQVRDARQWVERVASAGSVFVGAFSPEVAGDYASGTNHVLPTSGTARSSSGVSLESFQKKITFQELTRDGLENLAGTLQELAGAEGLLGHARAVTSRALISASLPDRPERTPAGTPRDFDLNVLVRSNIRTLRPYESARDAVQEGILLDANENPFSESILGVELNRYPDPQQKHLRRALAGHLGIAPEEVLCGTGSDEVLDWLLKVFCRPGLDRVAITPPTYGMYRVVADIHGVRVFESPLDGNFDFDGDDFLRKVPVDVKILILCSPNNPTANLLVEDEILKVCREWPRIVVVDEAYIEFSSRQSLARHIRYCPNLVVLRTFSKAAGRAGIRLGCALASAPVISYFSKVKMPYNLSAWTMEEGRRVLEHSERQTQLKAILGERERVRERLLDIQGIRQVFPSEANFVLFRCESASGVYRQLLSRGIVIRDRSSVPGLEGCLRVSIGTESENERFLEEIQGILEGVAK